MGGYVNRIAVIDSIRNVEKNVILIDAGDFVQGTPYYNIFKGRVETGAMNLMKYDVTAIGNHEFDYGIDTLAPVLKRLKFPVINCNYDFRETALKGVVKPYVIIKKAGVKIGFIGLGPEAEGLIRKNKSEGMKSLPGIETVNRYAERLKTKEKCDVVVCVSHAGYEQDSIMAEKSNFLDIIIGGHSHTFMKQPDVRKNLSGKDVMIYQVGTNGVYVGKIEIEVKGKKQSGENKPASQRFAKTRGMWKDYDIDANFS